MVSVNGIDPRFQPSLNRGEPAAVNAFARGLTQTGFIPQSLHDVATGVSVLRRGDSNTAVRDMQAALNRSGIQPPLAEDGIFGPKTEAALKGFQGAHGLPADGRFGIDALLTLQTTPGADIWTQPSAPGADRSRRAPGLDDPVPPGAVRAGDLARDAETRRNTSPANGATTRGADVQVKAPWLSQFDARNVPEAGPTACYRAVRAMMGRAGAPIAPNTGNRIQVATGEDSHGRVRTTPERTREARQYIDQQLDSGRPVAVGVSHKNANYNADGVTDHFVMITGRGTDERGRTYYNYHDPATTNSEAGKNNRFYVNPQNGNLVHEGSLASGYVRDRHTEMSMVVRSN
ncbi:MAG: peptidoglycan-binding protein [Deltaproteobacteria bacterium]|nr:peptidoglycan-binding protein [Deltaproteobacteria bacterium]